jgi:hypothetical protein
MLSRVTITSLGTTKATKLRRRLASTDQDEVAVNFEVAPPASDATAKTVEDCMTDLAAQASEPTSALLTDSFLSEHVTASSTAADGTTVAPPSFLAVSVVEAGKQSEDQFENLQAQITPTTETAASNAGGDSSPTGIIVGAIAGVLALSAVAIVLVRRNKQAQSAPKSQGGNPTPTLPRKLSMEVAADEKELKSGDTIILSNPMMEANDAGAAVISQAI